MPMTDELGAARGRPSQPPRATRSPPPAGLPPGRPQRAGTFRQPPQAASGDARSRAHTFVSRPMQQGFGGYSGPSLAEVAHAADKLPIGARSTARAGAESAADGGSMGGLLRRARSASANMRAWASRAGGAPDALTPQPHASISAYLPKLLTRNRDVRAFNLPPGQRPEQLAVRRHRLVLLGPGEAGKTSLMKSFGKGMQLFKSLPNVGTTTGIESSMHRVQVGDDKVDVEVMDFAGQEVYHAHSLFLTPRSTFIFVWDASLAEDAGQALTKAEERRLKRWADIVQAKCPGSRVVAIATHMDRMRDTSPDALDILLERVRGILEGYFATLTGSTEPLQMSGLHVVSCKDLTCAPQYSKLRDLYHGLCGLCLSEASSPRDDPFPHGMVPRSVVELAGTLEVMKASGTLLVSWPEFNRMTRELGIPRDQVYAVTQALHAWGLVYLFDRQSEKLGRHDCVFLHPAWLAKAVSAVFTYVHACTAPPHERECMEGTIGLLDVEACDRADPDRKITEGVLTTRYLAPALFKGLLADLGRGPTPANCDLCLSMLQHLDVLYPKPADEKSAAAPQRSATSAHSEFYIPSMFTAEPPPKLREHISSLFAAHGRSRRFRLVPFPKELVQMLHCRVHPAVVRLAVPPPPQPPPERAEVVIQRWDTAEPLGISFKSGLKLASVHEGMAAARAGAARHIGWEVTHVGAVEVRTAQQFAEEARRPGNGRRLPIRLANTDRPAPREIRNNWRAAWWLGGGGGAGKEVGRGPTRCFVVADPEGNAPAAGGTVDVFAMSPPDLAADAMSAEELLDHLSAQLVELLRKFPGITLTGQQIPRGEGPSPETMAAVRRGMQADEAEFLARAVTTPPGQEMDAGSRDMRVSLLLDAFVRSQMDPASGVADLIGDL